MKEKSNILNLKTTSTNIKEQTKPTTNGVEASYLPASDIFLLSPLLFRI